MSSLECQIQEDDMGDFVTLVNARANVYSSHLPEEWENYYKVTGENDKLVSYGGSGNPGYCHIQQSNEKQNGEWNTVEVICVNDHSIHVVNGNVVMIVRDSKKEINENYL